MRPCKRPSRTFDRESGTALRNIDAKLSIVLGQVFVGSVQLFRRDGERFGQ